MYFLLLRTRRCLQWRLACENNDIVDNLKKLHILIKFLHAFSLTPEKYNMVLVLKAH